MEIVERMCNFCDVHDIILSVESDLTEGLEELGFVENDNLDIPEYVLRKPIQTLSESVIMFSQDNPLLNNYEEVEDDSKIQSSGYVQQWYDKYIEIINSKEYQERRFKETTGILGKAKRRSGTQPIVGQAIVGQAIVA